MKVAPFAAALVAALALAGCGGGGVPRKGTTAPTVKRKGTTAPTETAAAPTTIAPTTTAAPAVGATQRQRDPDGSEVKVTVFRYRADSVLPGYLESELRKGLKRSVAAEVRVCIVRLPPGIDAEVSWSPWTLGDNEGRTYEAWSSYSDSVTVQPLYPNDGRRTPVDSCRRGWVPFELPRDARPTFIEYSPPEGNVLRWPIQK